MVPLASNRHVGNQPRHILRVDRGYPSAASKLAFHHEVALPVVANKKFRVQVLRLDCCQETQVGPNRLQWPTGSSHFHRAQLRKSLATSSTVYTICQYGCSRQSCGHASATATCLCSACMRDMLASRSESLLKFSGKKISEKARSPVGMIHYDWKVRTFNRLSSPVPTIPPKCE
jgi:hypothetical protein